MEGKPSQQGPEMEPQEMPAEEENFVAMLPPDLKEAWCLLRNLPGPGFEGSTSSVYGASDGGERPSTVGKTVLEDVAKQENSKGEQDGGLSRAILLELKQLNGQLRLMRQQLKALPGCQCGVTRDAGSKTEDN